jgi:sensor domain CHASE-containing protein
VIYLLLPFLLVGVLMWAVWSIVNEHERRQVREDLEREVRRIHRYAKQEQAIHKARHRIARKPRPEFPRKSEA